MWDHLREDISMHHQKEDILNQFLKEDPSILTLQDCTLGNHS
jgi:hypothetical protein